MTIKVRRIGCGGYQEIIFEEDNTTIKTGFLDAKEANKYADIFEDAANVLRDNIKNMVMLRGSLGYGERYLNNCDGWK